LFGLGTFLAIALHKPLDAVSITSLMAASGWSVGWRNAVNIGFAMMCPLGAVLFFLGVQQFSENQHIIIGCALAFSAGVFLCISLGDLLPEMEFHSHNRFRLSFVLLLGIALAYGIGFLEPEHAHQHGGHSHDAKASSSEHSHSHAH
ncbi:MAG: ZIP family metal transporter, partial [Planctomycetaceae bacterium]|nr:ZIP family metal transporter [Planctomycetaceae bacterium]